MVSISCGEPDAEEDKPIARKDLRIDCGISEDEAKEIPVGTRIAYATEPWTVGSHFFGKSLDNRSCYLSLLRAMELTKDETLPVNVAVLGSVQEEQGGLGALTGAYVIHPDVALVADVTFGDSPDSPKGYPLGSGVAIGYSPVLDREYTRNTPASGGAGEDPLYAGGHVRQHRHQLHAYADCGRRRAFGAAVPAPEIYAHPCGRN